MSSEASPSPNNVEDDYNTASESDEASQLESSDDILVEDGCDWLEQEEEFEGYSVVQTLRQLQALQRDRHRCAITGQISDYSFSRGAITVDPESTTGVAPTSAVHIIPPLTNKNHEVGFTFSMTVVLNLSHCIA